MHADTMARRSSGQTAAHALRARIRSGATMAEHADRIFLGNTEQGEAERQGDAVDRLPNASTIAAMPANAPLANGNATNASTPGLR